MTAAASWSKSCTRRNTKKVNMLHAFFIIDIAYAENAMYIAQSPLVSAFLSFGYNAACIALGGICGILTGVFTLFNRKTEDISYEDWG